MKKALLIFASIFISAIFAFTVKAQGTLQFNQVMVIGSTEETVPSGKVWKVEAIYGEQPNACVSVDCFSPGYFAKGVASGMFVNGTLVPSTLRGFGVNQNVYSNNTCTSYVLITT